MNPPHKTLQGKVWKKYCWTFDPWALDDRKPHILAETDLDALAEGNIGNYGLVLVIRHHNVQPQPDLQLPSHEEAVESEQKITYESVSDIYFNEPQYKFWKEYIFKENSNHKRASSA